MRTLTHRYTRPIGKRPYRKLYVIATEGTKTEPGYFDMLRDSDNLIRIEVLPSKCGHSPDKVLTVLKRYLTEQQIRSTDEAWLVVDRDDYMDKLGLLVDWCRQKENRFLAVSNPHFEYWLLLHFEDGKRIKSTRDCTNKLRSYLPDYDKDIDVAKIKPRINDAIRRAKVKDSPRCTDWPRTTGTTVYRLVEKLIQRPAS